MSKIKSFNINASKREDNSSSYLNKQSKSKDRDEMEEDDEE
jgi:hypothetical protein